MKTFPKKLQDKLEIRQAHQAFRKLGASSSLIDFSSNDYLGFSKSEGIFNDAHQFLVENNIIQNGATGSRLLSGNHHLYSLIEKQLCEFHNSESALVFNSGYDANIGFFSSVPQRGDVILYDEYIHASIRDGITMSHAKAYKFKHNNLLHLDEMIKQSQKFSGQHNGTVYIVTESVFSMDGDSPDLVQLSELSKKNNAYLVVDEAHAVGVFGENGKGLIQHLKLQNAVFARIITFGKALGCHGAAILGNAQLKDYLINFSRSFIYTTALPPHSLATIHSGYKKLTETQRRETLLKNITFFKSEIAKNNLTHVFIESHSAIHCAVIPGNEKVKSIAKNIQKQGFNVKPILSPTVPKGEERLRFCLHAFNSKEEISKVLKLLTKLVT